MTSLLRIGAITILMWILTRSLLFLLPGDPAELLVHESLVSSSVESIRESMKLGSISERIFSLPSNEAMTQKKAIHLLLLEAMKNTVILTLSSLFLTCLFTILCLFYAEEHPKLKTKIDSGSIVVASLPLIVMAPLFLLLLPGLHFILPSLTLSIYLTSIWYRALSKKIYLTSAQSPRLGLQALGFSPFKVFLNGTLAPNLGSFAGYIGTQIGMLLNGSLIIETVFQLNGIAHLIATAVLSRDYPVVEAGLILVTFLSLTSQEFGRLLQKRWEPRLTR